MYRIILVMIGLPVLLLIAISCRDTGGDNPDGTDVDVDVDADGDGDGDGDGDVDGDGDADGDTGFTVCETTDVNLSAVATRVMLVEDKSGSMDQDDKWPQAVSAIETMVTAFDNQIEFGLDLFNISEQDDDSCEVGTSAVLDTALGNGQAILNRLANTGPNSATPLLLEMQNFLYPDYAPAFSAPGANKYLVIVSDGQDTCGTDGVFNQRNGANAQELGDAAADLADEGIGTIVVGFGSGADPEQLNAIAAAGGTAFDQYIEAGDGDALTAALSDIAETVAVSCIFELDNYDPDTVNTDLVVVEFDGTAIPRDDNCAADTGWSWADADRTTIEFCDAACAQVESNSVSNIQVVIACAGDEVPVIVPVK